MVEVIEVLKEACEQVYLRIKEIAGKPEASEEFGLGAGGDISKKIDLIAEKTIIESVTKHGMDVTILGEECGLINVNKKTELLIMDGIDGTTNAIAGIPFYCCSIGYSKGPKLSLMSDAAVIDLISGDIYSASKGAGAYLNGERIKVKRIDEKKDTMIGVNISGADPLLIQRIAPLIARAKHVRHMGANALELCLLAKGAMDAYVDLRGKIRITDMAAAYLLVKEAGGNLYETQLGKEQTELDCNIETGAKMSFVAVADLNILNQLL